MLLVSLEASSVAGVKAAHGAGGDSASDADEGRDHQHPHLHPVCLARLAPGNAPLRKTMAFTVAALLKRIRQVDRLPDKLIGRWSPCAIANLLIFEYNSWLV